MLARRRIERRGVPFGGEDQTQEGSRGPGDWRIITLSIVLREAGRKRALHSKFPFRGCASDVIQCRARDALALPASAINLKKGSAARSWNCGVEGLLTTTTTQ